MFLAEHGIELEVRITFRIIRDEQNEDGEALVI